MKDEKYRKTKMNEGYNEESIKELDELAATLPKVIPMTSAERLANYGRTTERIEQGGGTNTVRGGYEL